MAENIEETEEIFNESFVDEPSDDNSQDLEEDVEKDSVAKLLAKLNSSGAIIKRPVRLANRCHTCVEDFDDIEDFHEHLIGHVSLPFIVLERCDADDSDYNEDDDDWASDNENIPEFTHRPLPIKTENLNITKFLESNRGGLTITSNKPTSNNAALQSLKSINNICIKKVTADNIDSEEMSRSPTPDLTKTMESSGTLKLTIKHTSDNTTFHVVNGNQNIKSENTNIENRLATNVPEDNKQGILEKCLALPIKAEPLYTSDSICSSNSNQSSALLENVTVKSEASSRPHSPAESGSDASGNQIKVKEFAMEQTDSQKSIVIPKPMIIPKVEADNIIEINCDDSDKDDDEIIFIGSSVTTEDKKPPIVPKLEPFPQIQNTYVSKSQSVASSPNSSTMSISSNSHLSTAKEHGFNWTTSPTKHNDSLESMLTDKNTDALFESLLSNHRKDGISDLGASEYISLDKLGPQHECDKCNIRFTSMEGLEHHKKSTGHSNQLVIPSSNSMALSTYQQPGFLMNNVNNLLPVKQLAETVSKITSANSSNQYTHQQNITVNIQSYPGSIANQQHTQPQSAYNYNPGSYQPAMPGYRMPNQNMHAPYPPQYPPSSYPNAYSQYTQPQPPMYNHPPYPPQPMPQYPQNQYPPNHQSGGQLISQYPPIPANNQTTPISSGPQIAPHTNITDHTSHMQNSMDSQNKSGTPGGIKIQSIQTISSPTSGKPSGPRMMLQKNEIRGQIPMRGGTIRGGRGGIIRPGMSPMGKPGPGVKVSGQAVRGIRPGMIRGQMKRPAPSNGAMMSPSKKRMEMDDCQVVSMQHQRDNLPHIQNVQGARDKAPIGVQLSSQITVTKKKVRPPTPPIAKDTSAMASMLASRGIKITPKQKPNIPNLGSNISITSSRSSLNNFSLPEDLNDMPCNQCNKMFSNSIALSVHMAQSHPGAKMHYCDNCPLSFATSFQLQDHKRNFHNVPNAEIGIPVIELSQQNTIRKLNSIGITNFIPLGNRDHGYFGIPIISTQSALNGKITNNLQQLGIDGILSLGPVKPLPRC